MTCPEMAVLRCSLGKVRISAVTMDDTLHLLGRQAKTDKPACICVANMRATVFA